MYIDDKNGGSGLNEVSIIDGQQRLTTIYILLKALYDVAKNVSEDARDEIKGVMFNKNCDEEFKIKLKPVETDNAQLEHLINNRLKEMDISSNVYKNYIIFKKLIGQLEVDKSHVDNILNGIRKLEIVEIICLWMLIIIHRKSCTKSIG